MLSDNTHSPFAGSTPFLTFGELGEAGVPLSDLCSSLKELPLDGVIGFLATLSWNIAKEGVKTADPRWQAFYLNMALVDDFPRTPRRLSQYLAPGRVPSTGTSNVFIHNQNLAILAHLAVIYCPNSSFTPRFEEALKQRVCRLLLLINDLLNEPVPQTSSPTLRQRKEFCLRWLRLHQFGLETPFFTRAAHNIARQSKLYSLVQEHGLFDVEGTFLASSQGVSLDETFQLLAVLLVTVYLKLGGRAWWLPRTLMHTPTLRGRHIIESLGKKWIRTPAEYRKRWRVILGDADPYDVDHAFDLVCLRESPLIAARSDSVACPCLPFLRDLIPDAPYFLILDSMNDPRKKQRFQTSLGEGFSCYVEELLDRIATGDCRGPWAVHHRVEPRAGTELVDSILLRGRTVIAFEHKGQRPGSSFLSGHSGKLVLGPTDEMLTEISLGQEFNRKKAKDSDHGLLTHGMWQQSMNGPAIVAWTKEISGEYPTKVYPVLVNLYGPRMDAIVRGVYIEQLIEDAGLYDEPFWGRPQWLIVTDLEALAALADSGVLDLERHLARKDGDETLCREGFDRFLFQEFESIPIDRKLAEYAMSHFRDAGVFFREDPEP